MMQLLPQEQGQLLDLLWREERIGHAQVAVEVGTFLRQLVPTEAQGDETFAQARVLGIHQALLDQLE